MTTNHPARGPASLDRLHQIREILSKAAAQSDGGNLGYAMADAVKVIDGAIAVFGTEPQRNPVLAYADSYRDMAKRGVESIPVWSVITDLERNIAPLYTAPTAQVVPTFDEWLAIRGNKPLGWVKDAMRESYDACRAAMLQADNSPVTQDGYVLVPKKLTAENGAKRVLSGEFSETKFINCPGCFGDDDCETCDGSGRIEITVPVTWTTIKAIWAKGVEHFAAAPQQHRSSTAAGECIT
ncbi:TPA: hypothetical protein NF036_004451 [Escherichia coli]|nr:hypothetical protein [Escherichia coli]